MKICTITCHDVYNYGASLQAFALQYYLQSLGHDVRIIDYKPDYQPNYKFSTKVSRESPLYAKYQKYPALKIIRGIKNYIEKIPTFGRKKAFENFKNQFLNLTRRYTSYHELAEYAPEADLYITGSDQVWSTFLPNGSDPAFYLCFGPLNAKRISYSASFGYPDIKYGKDQLVKSLLSRVDCLSVREQSGVELLSELGYHGEQVLDPVFLLNSEEWRKALNLGCDSKYGKYLLVYDLHANTKEIADKAKELAKQHGLKIVAVNDSAKTKYADVNINNASPLDFVELIANAQFVLADSFHATSFALIFHKPMWAYYKYGNAGRIASILSIVGLADRLNTTGKVTEPNWNSVDEKIETEIMNSKQYLVNNCNI